MDYRCLLDRGDRLGAHPDGRSQKRYATRLSATERQILSPPGATAWSPTPRADTALVKAIVRAHRWRRMIESGEYFSSAELARAEKINESYLGRILRLTLIAPDITEAILAGRQPSTLQLDDLLKALPSAWAEQHSALFDPR
jgi:hypothetical protein